MEQEIIELIKKEYENNKKKKEATIKMINRLNELKQDKNVSEYIELSQTLCGINYETVINRTDDTLLYYAFCRYNNKIKESKEIYVCLGTYKYSGETDIIHGGTDDKVSDDDPNANYKKYCNLETEDTIHIPIRKGNLSLVEQFENTHTIIFPKTKYPKKYFNELQQEYLKEIITTNEEQAYKKILERTQKRY